jgi:hypothetical protein
VSLRLDVILNLAGGRGERRNRALVKTDGIFDSSGLIEHTVIYPAVEPLDILAKRAAQPKHVRKRFAPEA